MTDENDQAADDVAEEYADEEVIFRPDGTVLLKLLGTRYRLKRPKYRELKAIREEAVQNAEDSRDFQTGILTRIADLLAPVQDQIRGLSPRPTGGEDDPDVEARVALIAELTALQESDEFKALRAEQREAVEDSDRKALEWFRDGIMRRLGSPAARGFDGDDVFALPSWVVDQEFVGELMAHWSSVPRRPGVA